MTATARAPAVHNWVHGDVQQRSWCADCGLSVDDAVLATAAARRLGRGVDWQTWLDRLVEVPCPPTAPGPRACGRRNVP